MVDGFVDFMAQLVFVNNHFIGGHITNHIRHVKKVIRKILLNDVAPVATANHEIIHPVSRVELKNMPKNRLPPDLDDWLELEVGFLGNTGPESPSEHEGFHLIQSGLKFGCFSLDDSATSGFSKTRGTTWPWKIRPMARAEPRRDCRML
jgi:hypothetical protein